MCNPMPPLFTANLKSNAGFSIAEVLLSIAITILLVDLIIHACITLVNQHNLLKEKTTIAENAQFAEFILRREIQTAGFFGCNTFNQLDIHYHLKKSYLPIIPLQILSKNACMPDDIHSESDVIVIEKMSEKTVDFLSQKKSMAIKASKENPFEVDEPIVIADCQQADIFLPSAITYGNSFQTIKTKKALQHRYDNGLLGKLVATAFFVGETHRKNAYGKAIHALYSYDLINRRKIELVSGVDAMDVFYAEQDSDDHEINFNPVSTTIDSLSIRLIKIVLLLSNEDSLFSKKEILHTKKEILIFLRELA